MNRYLLCIIISIASSCMAKAQTTFNKVVDFTGYGNNVGFTMFTSSLCDSDYFLVAGADRVPGVTGQNAVIAQYEYSGQLLWQKNLLAPGPINTSYQFNSLISYQPGRYAVLGVEQVLQTGVRYPFIYLFDRNGDSLAFYKFVDTTVSIATNSIGYLNDGSLLFVGWYINASTNTTGLMMKKVDTLGNGIWEVKHNIRSFANTTTTVPSRVLPLEDGGALIAGVDYWNAPVIGLRYTNFVLKVDSAGNIVWKKNYPSPYWEMPAIDIHPSGDGGFYFLTNTSYIPSTPGSGPTSSKFFYGRCNQNGDTLWTRQFADTGQAQGFTTTNCTSMNRRSNGDLLLLGYAYYDSYPHPLLVITDSFGNVKSYREYAYKPVESTLGHEAWNVHETPSRQLLITGTISTQSPIPNVFDSSGQWGWLVQTDSFGCLIPGCQEADTQWVTPPAGIATTIGATQPLVLYPNPAESSFRVSGFDAGTVTVMDITGRVLFKQETLGDKEVSVVSLPTGLYNVLLQTTTGVQKAFRLSKL